jgi:Tfp pilus assembly protein PilF
MVRERYHRSGHLHVAGRRRAPRSILGYIALDAMRAGDRKRARAALVRALRFDPFRVKNYLRLARTFLPAALARAMSGKSERPA